ncbi:MAG TPA: Holliday junction resolvase RuvX [Candidatus Kaiserbacteria bacterium]|nr:Holliday junction resolvase RuvX [Candidatus Kaiserbacteria bacterium]
MRYLGIDYGSKKTGIAFSDDAGTMGFPRGVIFTDKNLAERLSKLIGEEKVGAVVIGESKNFDGTDNPIATEARTFARELRSRANVPIFFETEIFTTQEARRLPTGERVSGGVVDAAAAALILTSYLSKNGNN